MMRTTEALAAFQLSLSIAERLGAVIDEIRALTNIAYECRHIGACEQGLAHLQRAQTLCASVTDRGSDLAEQQQKIHQFRGDLLTSLQRHEEALACYVSVLQADTRIYGPRSREVAAVMSVMAKSYLYQGQLMVAMPTINTAVSIAEECGVNNGDIYINALEHRGEILAAMGQHDEALTQFERCLALRRERLRTDPSISRVLENIANSQLKLGRGEEAHAALVEAIKLRRRLQTQCAGPACSRYMREDGAPLDVCVNCRCTFYCGKACQTAAGRRATRPSARRSSRRRRRWRK